MNSATGQWLQAITQADTQQAIADRLGVDRTTINRWLKHGISADAVISAARTCNSDPIEGLITTGFLTQDEANQNASISQLGEVPLLSLLKAAVARLEGAA